MDWTVCPEKRASHSEKRTVCSEKWTVYFAGRALCPGFRAARFAGQAVRFAGLIACSAGRAVHGAMATIRLPVLNGWRLGQVDRKLTPMVEEGNAADRVPARAVQRWN